uniref:Hypothetical chloroplast RF88 n=1 Tax=Climaconeis cf. scalaris TaxID=2846828 RepID=A0A8F8SPY7_9STRA|nr:hypothetical protein [Climaconeis cf. scalaris]QYB19171.1 hypothetical chloroplast RF88 [Climaconeis cf. scalaris]
MNAFFYSLRCRCKELYFDFKDPNPNPEPSFNKKKNIIKEKFKDSNSKNFLSVINAKQEPSIKKYDKSPSYKKKAKKIVKEIIEKEKIIKNSTDLKTYIKNYEIRKKGNKKFKIPAVLPKYNRSEIPPVLNEKTFEKFTFKTLEKYQIFKIKYNQNLSRIAKLTLANLQNKHIYSAIDDILYNSKLDPIEGNMFLSTLHSIMISLHNSFSIDFFSIFIKDIYIEKVFNDNNKFINNNTQFSEQITFITLYKDGLPIKKKDVIW